MVERKDVIKATKLIGPADLHTRVSDLVLLPSFLSRSPGFEPWRRLYKRHGCPAEVGYRPVLALASKHY